MIKRLIFFFLLIFAELTYAQPIAINNYQEVFYPGLNKGKIVIAIRYFYRNKQPYFLIVNPYSFQTQLISAVKFSPRKDKSYQAISKKVLDSTPYIQALNSYTNMPNQTNNSGIIHAEYPAHAVFLTIDMCPSYKPMEYKFFHALVDRSQSQRAPLPIAISITGLWILGHPTAFHWLMTQAQENHLAITWINHSFSHVYYYDQPDENNFLLMPETNARHEILGTEKLLLENNQLPSVFFRFPGLISNHAWMQRLKRFGLIPVGSDAWLAKNQKIQAGSIILVHGNSNEHQGIRLMMQTLDQQPSLQFLPISELFAK
jgi:hypothetical protein